LISLKSNIFGFVSRSVPEGTRVPVNNACFTVENTDEESAWLVGYVEGLLEQIW
jgi:hypothetical protein